MNGPVYPLLECMVEIGAWADGCEVYPDTGFDGGLSIPEETASQIESLPYWTRLRFADNDVQSVPAWSGMIELAGRRFRCEVVAVGSRFLLGREVLDQLEICFSFGRTIHLDFRD